MPLVRLKEFRKSQAGVYVISPQPPEDETIMFKIGRTIQMNKRLNAYHICFPDGFHIYKALMLNSSYNPKGNAVEKKRCVAMTMKLEKFVHDHLDDHRHKSTTRAKHEWFGFTGDLHEINEALIACHTKYKSDTDYPILVFSKKGFYDYFYIDGVEEVKIATKRLGISDKPPIYIGGKVKMVEGEPKIEGGATTRAGRQVVRPSKFKDSEFFDLKKRVTKKWN
jgi:hypothetical protein